jgi:hypothetical protein
MAFQKMAFILASSLTLILPSLTAQEFSLLHKVQEKTLHLHGRGEIKVLGVLSILSAGLYLEKGTDGREALLDVPKRLELLYARPIKAEEFAKAANKTLKKTLSKEA